MVAEGDFGLPSDEEASGSRGGGPGPYPGRLGAAPTTPTVQSLSRARGVIAGTIGFILAEIPRQRKTYKKVAEACLLEKDTFYRWQSGQTKRVDIRTVEQVLRFLGYDLVPLPVGREE